MRALCAATLLLLSSLASAQEVFLLPARHGSPPPAPVYTLLIEQDQWDTLAPINAFGGDDPIAQLFTLPFTLSVDRVTLELVRNGSPTGDITVEIWTASGGEPDTLITGAVSDAVDVSGIETAFGGETITFDFQSPATLTADVQYALVAQVTYSQSSSDYIGAYAEAVGPYSGGTYCQGSWFCNAWDLDFEVWTADLADPTDFCGTLAGWWTPETLEADGTDNDEIATWTDSSSSGNDITCDTGAQTCPLYTEDIVGQWWGAEGTNTPREMNLDTPFSDSGDFLVGLVVYTDNGAGPSIGSNAPSNRGFYRTAANVWTGNFNAGDGIVYADDSTTGDSEFHTLVWERASETIEQWTDAVLITSPVTQSTTSDDTFLVDSLWNHGTFDSSSILEVFLCGESGDSDAANAYLFYKYQ